MRQRQETDFFWGGGCAALGGQRSFTGLTPVVEVDLLPGGKVVDQRAWRQMIVI